MTANEQRAAVIGQYETLLGRNKYSQPRRAYAFRPYSDGNYYSDCSSSVALAYAQAGLPIDGATIPNTVGLYNSKKLTDVPVQIENGLITNPEVLRPGDLLLFAGNDVSRKSSGYVGHVELLAKTGSEFILYGHGSGTPRAIKMDSYLKSRRKLKSDTPLGHRGLIRVRRFIPDDAGRTATVTGGCVNLRTGPGVGYPVTAVVKKGDALPVIDPEGWIPVLHAGHVRWISGSYAKL